MVSHTDVKALGFNNTLKTIFFLNYPFNPSILCLVKQMCVGTSGESNSRLSLSFYLLQKVILQVILKVKAASRDNFGIESVR